MQPKQQRWEAKQNIPVAGEAQLLVSSLMCLRRQMSSGSSVLDTQESVLTAHCSLFTSMILEQAQIRACIYSLASCIWLSATSAASV
jgi:hypothetical protein